MAPLSGAVELNDFLVKMIQARRERGLVKLFKPTRLSTLKIQMPAELEKDDDVADVPTAGAAAATEGPSYTIKSVSTGGFLSAAVVHDSVRNRPAEPYDSFFTMFNRAFDFVPADCTATNRTAWTEAAANIAPAIMYNAGLFHHIVVVQDSSRDMFNVALTHYTESFKRIQQNSDLGLHRTDMDLLYMALLNNMGHCRARLHDTTCMMISYDYLRMAYTSTTQGRRLTKEEDDFFRYRIRLGMAYMRLPAGAA
jgi:hypothetical protein